MVSRAYYPPATHDAGLRYLSSRSCGPYLSYPERRYQLASHDSRAITMPDPQGDEGSPPRKRIAVAVSPFSHVSPTRLGDQVQASLCRDYKMLFLQRCLTPGRVHTWTTYLHMEKQVYIPRGLLMVILIIVWTMPQAQDPLQRRSRRKFALCQLQECRR